MTLVIIRKSPDIFGIGAFFVCLYQSLNPPLFSANDIIKLTVPFIPRLGV